MFRRTAQSHCPAPSLEKLALESKYQIAVTKGEIEPRHRQHTEISHIPYGEFYKTQTILVSKH